jgi:dihydroorotase (multifunctional complex type)
VKVDRLIVGGDVALPGGIQAADIAINDGLIKAVIRPGGDRPPSNEVIDAAGLLVMPGMVDVHVHTREPGYEHKETMETCTQAAAAGGVTTIFAMPNLNPAPTNLSVLREILASYESTSLVDFNLNAAPTDPTQILPMADAGIAAFKIYMVVDTGREYPHPAGVGVHDHGRLLEIMEQIAPTGLPFMVHPHDQSLMDHIEQGYWHAGDRSPAAYAKTLAAYDGLIWDTAVAVLVRLAEATGCRLHIVHVQTEGTLEMLRRARARKLDVTSEVNHWALFLSRWSDVMNLGPYALSYFVPDEARTALWEGLTDGTVDIVSSDHAPHTREEKDIGWSDMWAAHTGTPGIDFQLPLLLDSALRGMVSLERAVDAVTTRPADIFGLHNKGRIVPGADADVALVDLSHTWTISDEDTFTKVGWSPYSGRQVQSKVIQTMVRGVDVYKGGSVVGTPGHGTLAAPRSKGERR